MKRFAAAVIAFALLAFSSLAFAMGVGPVLIQLETLGSQSAGQITVQNSGASAMPVEVRVYRLEINENGERTKVLDEENFVVFPAQAVVPAGQTQVVRVQWVGDPALARSQSYVVNVSQVAVALPEQTEGAAIQLLYAFDVIMTVAPPRTRPELSVVETGIETVDGRSRPVVVLQNVGARHAFLAENQVDVELFDASGRSVWRDSLSPAEIQQGSGFGLVMPDARRRIVLPVDLPSSEGTIRARLIQRQLP